MVEVEVVTIDDFSDAVDEFAYVEQEQVIACMNSRGFDVSPGDLEGQPPPIFNDVNNYWDSLNGTSGASGVDVSTIETVDDLPSSVGCRAWGLEVLNRTVVDSLGVDPSAAFEGDFEDLVASDPVLQDIESQLVACVNAEGFEVTSMAHIEEERFAVQRAQVSEQEAPADPAEFDDAEVIEIPGSEPYQSTVDPADHQKFSNVLGQCESEMAPKFEQRLAELFDGEG